MWQVLTGQYARLGQKFATAAVILDETCLSKEAMQARSWLALLEQALCLWALGRIVSEWRLPACPSWPLQCCSLMPSRPATC